MVHSDPASRGTEHEYANVDTKHVWNWSVLSKGGTLFIYAKLISEPLISICEQKARRRLLKGGSHLRISLTRENSPPKDEVSFPETLQRE